MSSPVSSTLAFFAGCEGRDGEEDPGEPANHSSQVGSTSPRLRTRGLDGRELLDGQFGSSVAHTPSFSIFAVRGIAFDVTCRR